MNGTCWSSAKSSVLCSPQIHWFCFQFLKPYFSSCFPNLAIESGLELSTGAASVRSHMNTACQAMGSGSNSLIKTSDMNSASAGGQHTRYIYFIPLQTLTGQGGPERDCESPNPVQVLSKIRDHQESDPQFLHFQPHS